MLLCLVTLAALAFYLGVELAFSNGRPGVPLDDAWIHFQFARNLSQGQGFSFNPGQAQPGSTAPLWTVLLAFVGLFTQQFVAPALALSALFLLLSVILCYGFTVWLTGSRGAGFLAGLGTALAGRLLWAGLAGMETTAFAALSVAAVWAYGLKGLRPSTAFLFGLAGQIRPEGHMLFLLALFEWLMVNGQWRMVHWKRVFRQLGAPLLVYLVIALPYTLFSLHITGHPLPNTFYAKVGAEHFFSLRTFRETAWLHWSDNPASVILAALGLFPLWKRSRLTLWWLVGLPLLTAVLIDQTWHHGRYTMPLIPFQMITAAVGAYWVIKNLSKKPRLLFVLFLVFLILGASWQFRPWANMLAQNVNEVLEIDVALGEWLAANTPADALIAVDDIGAIAFLSERRIVDMNGLVSPEVWPAMRQPLGLARDAHLTRILSHSRPDYVVAFPLWHWPLTQNTAVTHPIHKVETGSHTIIFQPEAFVYEVVWPYGAAKPPDTALEATFDDMIQLAGYDMVIKTTAVETAEMAVETAETAVETAEMAVETTVETAVDLILYWHSLATAPADYDVFVHLLDENGTIVAQIDQQPLAGLAPTSLWQPGDTIRHPLSISLPPGLPPASYRLMVGLFLRQTGQRLTAVGPTAAGDMVNLTSITLQPSGTWENGRFLRPGSR